MIAASYPAKAKGVRTGMRLNDAKALCPDAIALLSDFTEACRASGQIETILRSLTPAVEQMSVDEWYLDLRELVGGIPSDPGAWARTVQQTISQSVGIGMSVGIAQTKLLAKMASEYRKPAGITIVSDEPSHTAYCILKRPSRGGDSGHRARQTGPRSLFALANGMGFRLRRAKYGRPPLWAARKRPAGRIEGYFCAFHR